MDQWTMRFIVTLETEKHEMSVEHYQSYAQRQDSCQPY